VQCAKLKVPLELTPRKIFRESNASRMAEKTGRFPISPAVAIGDALSAAESQAALAGSAIPRRDDIADRDDSVPPRRFSFSGFERPKTLPNSVLCDGPALPDFSADCGDLVGCWVDFRGTRPPASTPQVRQI
jgi:hypothetical protein